MMLFLGGDRVYKLERERDYYCCEPYFGLRFRPPSVCTHNRTKANTATQSLGLLRRVCGHVFGFRFTESRNGHSLSHSPLGC